MEKIIVDVFEVTNRYSGEKFEGRQFFRSGERHQVDIINGKGEIVHTVNVETLNRNYIKGKSLI